MRKLVVGLHDEAAIDIARFGSKAANQAILGRAGLPIQDGFCLDAEAYRMQLRASGLEGAAMQAAAAEHAGEDARELISQVRIGLFDQPIIPEILDQLVQAYRNLDKGPAARTVVRSSALMEDKAGSTFAGQFETFLDLENEEDFLTAVRACWAALWSPRALKYMATHGIDPMDSAMALCVQPLVEARVSGGGISHTADGKMLLSATWGLGTTIAQGEVVPDRYELSRDGEVLETMTGRKQHSIYCRHHGAQQSANLASADSNPELCLNPEQVSIMAQMLMTAEQLMGAPVEIEWAMDSNGFKMLQSRPLHVEQRPVLDKTWADRPGLRGQPSGTGFAAGRSCVISCECEMARVSPGDILITKVAGPSLSEILGRVSGVVAELGGSTSHLASLARERGIPMVLGVQEATTKIPEGVQVGVDGVMGMVHWQ